MKQAIFTIQENAPLAASIYRMRLRGDAGGITAPGQFVNIRLDGFFLRRPISVCDWDEESVTLIYKTVGRGTERMARLAPGTEMNLLTGLGNGYALDAAGKHTLVLGGGVGVPPLYALTKALVRRGGRVSVRLGFNTAADAFYLSEFKALTEDTRVYTVDGSLGNRGFVTDDLPPSADYVFACGPLPMLRAVAKACPAPGQFSMEERMGCGFGACMGCAVQTARGPMRVCREGPVFQKEDLLWDD